MRIYEVSKHLLIFWGGDDLVKTIEHVTTRMAGDERRQQLLQIAMRLFSKDGFDGTTTKQIATEAGVSEATLFKHFANKDELYRAILDEKSCSPLFTDPFEKIVEYLDKKDDFGVFYTMALNALKNHKDDTDFLRLMMYSALEGHELARSFFMNFIQQMYDLIGNYIKTRQDEGVFREIEPRIVVRAFSGMFVHHSLNNLLWDKEQKLLKISDEEAAREFATILLNGIKKEEVKS
jgi:AcrR family transcriptional regulator